MNPDPLAPAPLRARRHCWIALLGCSLALTLELPTAASAAPETSPPTQPADTPDTSVNAPDASVNAPEAPAKSTEPPAARFDLLYLAPNECPTRQEFVTWTNQFYRGSDADLSDSATASSDHWLAAPGELAGSVRVKVVSDGNEYTAHLVMVDAEGQCPTSRPPHTETACTDAVKAMAYSLAQALKAPPCAATADASAPSKARDKPCPPPAPVLVSRSVATPRPAERLMRGEVGFGLGIVSPLAEDVAWGGVLFAGLVSPARGLSGRLSAGYWNAGRVPIGYALDAELWSAGVSVCPFTIDLNRWLSLPLCATAELGTVALSGVGTAADADASGNSGAATNENDRANLYLWSSLGVAPRLRLERRWLFMEIEPNLVLPLLRHPVYVHQPGNEASERENAGQVGGWMALKAHLNAGIVFP